MKKLYFISFIIILTLNCFSQTSQGLVAHYPFNGNANDESGNGHNGTIIGNPLFVNDRFGNPLSALSFNGIDEWIEINSSTLFPSEAITMCYWINRNGNSILNLQNYISKEESFQSYVYPDSTFVSGYWLGSPGVWSSYPSDSYLITNLSEWIFYAFTWDNNTQTARVYINGVLVSTFTETDPNYYLRTSTQKMYLGRNGSSNVYHIQGIFDDVSIYNRVLSEQEIWELITDLDTENQNFYPSEFALVQNYPNPFNPMTKISYTIQSVITVELMVYNLLGQLIKTLVNEEKPAGFYEVDFNAADLPSGVYIYRLKAGNFIDAKKMILIK